jgi:hypothetical protein
VKFKPKRGYKRRTGHRQDLTRIEVTAVELAARSARKAAAEPATGDETPKPAAAAPEAADETPKPVAAAPEAADETPKPVAAAPAVESETSTPESTDGT